MWAEGVLFTFPLRNPTTVYCVELGQPLQKAKQDPERGGPWSCRALHWCPVMRQPCTSFLSTAPITSRRNSLPVFSYFCCPETWGLLPSFISNSEFSAANFNGYFSLITGHRLSNVVPRGLYHISNPPRVVTIWCSLPSRVLRMKRKCTSH